MSGGKSIYLTNREVAVLHFVAKHAIEDMDAGDIRSALARALRKMRTTFDWLQP